MKSSVLQRDCIIFYNSIGFTKRIYHFYKIIGFTEQIYENKSLSPNQVFTFKISRFTTFIFLLIILLFFINIINFLTKIGPIWAHKGPYGPGFYTGPEHGRNTKEHEWNTDYQKDCYF